MNSSSLSSRLCWYAVQVPKSSEEKVEQKLSQRQFRTYLPAQVVRRRYSDRTKLVRIPYYPGYLFCESDLETMLPIKTTPGVIGIVSCAGKPCSIPRQELESIQLLAASGMTLGTVEQAVAGQNVEIIAGPLKGMTGVIASVEGEYVLAVAISLLNRSLTVRLDALDVEVISASTRKFIPSGLRLPVSQASTTRS